MLNIKLKQKRILNLENNELRELPKDLSKFENLEDMNLSGNAFESDHKAAELWFSLARIKKLKMLNIARNYLRGIFQILFINFYYFFYLDLYIKILNFTRKNI